MPLFTDITVHKGHSYFVCILYEDAYVVSQAGYAVSFQEQKGREWQTGRVHIRESNC